jgi:hypothetical protein
MRRWENEKMRRCLNMNSLTLSCNNVNRAATETLILLLIYVKWLIWSKWSICRYDLYARYASRSGFSISCGSRWVRRQWDVDVCYFQKQCNVKIDKCYLTQIGKIIQYNQFQNSLKCDIIYWDKIAELPNFHWLARFWKWMQRRLKFS